MVGSEASVTSASLRDLLVAYSGNVALKDLSATAPLRTVFDSLAHFSFLMVVEKEFGLAMSDDSFTLDRMGTLDGIVAVIEGSKASSIDPAK